jgi:hypothetical protein
MIGAGTVMTGGVVSATVTENVAGGLALWWESSALHVTVVDPSANTEPDAGAHVTGSEPSTASDAVAVNATGAPLGPVASLTIGAGTVMTGGVVSTTVTGNVAWLAPPWLSTALHVTVVGPNPNTEPDTGAHVTGSEPSTTSDAVTVYPTDAPLESVACATIGGAGTVMTGGVSTTVTENVAGVLGLPWESTALHVTVVVPNPNSEPDAGAHVGRTGPSTRSNAVAV